MSIFLVAPINACSFFKIFSTKRFQTWYILEPYATGLHILKMRHLDFFSVPMVFFLLCNGGECNGICKFIDDKPVKIC